jgi:hypothetical protein
VNEGLLKHSPGLLSQPNSYGSVVFRFTSFNAMNLYATAVASIQGEPIAFPMRARPAPQSDIRPDGSKPGSLEGIWWQPRPGLKDVLVISNSSPKKINATLSLFDASGKQWSVSLPFAPYRTLRFSVSDLLQKAGLSGSYGGIKLDVPASTALNGVHFMYDEGSKFSEVLAMSPRDPTATVRERTGTDAKQWTMRAPMLALSSPDPTVALPAGTTLQPTIFVRNTTANKTSANITLNWRGDYATGQVLLPALDLPPFATQQLQIGPMQQQLGIPNNAHWALVTITTSAQPDDLIAVASSPDNIGRYHIDTEFSGTATGHFTGGEWRSDANRNQIISVTNSGQKPADALLSLHYDDGQKTYEMKQSIQPGDQILINVAELIHNRVADRKGHTMPADLTDGTYEVKDLGSGRGSLSVGGVTLDKTLGFQAQPPSPDCCAQNGPDFDPGDYSLYIDQFVNIGATATDQCTGDPENIVGQLTSWWSGNTAIATATKAQVTGVSAGTTTANASGEVLECSGNTEYFENVNLSAPVSVQPPVITGVAPSFGQVGTNPTVTISGSGFGSAGTISGPNGVALNGITVAYGTPRNDSTVTAIFTIAAGAPLGSQQIVATNNSVSGDGGSNQSNPGNFQVTPATAVPVNFQQTNATDEGGGYIRVTYTWGSSTGKLSDLSACQVQEYVTYPTTGNSGCPAPNTGQVCYWPPSPPWPPTSQNGTGYVNPTAVPGPATAGGAYDSNTVQNLNFVKPYSNSSFQANQVQQYSCNNGPWVQFGGPFTITRQVMQNSQGQWVFSISKTGVSFSSTYLLP